MLPRALNMFLKPANRPASRRNSSYDEPRTEVFLSWAFRLVMVVLPSLRRGPRFRSSVPPRVRSARAEPPTLAGVILLPGRPCHHAMDEERLVGNLLQGREVVSHELVSRPVWECLLHAQAGTRHRHLADSLVAEAQLPNDAFTVPGDCRAGAVSPPVNFARRARFRENEQ